MSSVNLHRREAIQIIEATFPEYTGNKITAEIAETLTFHGTMWDGGCRRVYKILRLADLKVVPVPQAPYAQESPRHEIPHKIEPGFVVVVHVFAGQREYLEIIGRAENVTPMLPAPATLTTDEETVLIATRSLKSSYAGVKDYRFHEARRYRGITRERWDVAKQALMTRKYLTAAGAITVEGKNAVGWKSL